VQIRLIAVCKEALEYFLSFKSEKHRADWTYILLIVLTRVYKMSDDRVSLVLIIIIRIELNYVINQMHKLKVGILYPRLGAE